MLTLLIHSQENSKQFIAFILHYEDMKIIDDWNLTKF